MNFRTFKITKKLLLKPINFYDTRYRNYHCEKWIKEQEIEKIKQLNSMTIKSLNMNQKEIFFHNQIKKILEQNNILLSNQNQQNNELELIKKYIVKEQNEI
jgi:hypothetical protein